MRVYTKFVDSRLLGIKSRAYKYWAIVRGSGSRRKWWYYFFRALRGFRRLTVEEPKNVGWGFVAILEKMLVALKRENRLGNCSQDSDEAIFGSGIP